MYGEPAIALDFGAYNVRTGWAGDDMPISMERNLLDGSCPLTHPVGEVTSWDAIERIWKREMMRPEVNYAKHDPQPCIMANVPALASARDREGYVRLIMESDGAFAAGSFRTTTTAGPRGRGLWTLLLTRQWSSRSRSRRIR